MWTLITAALGQVAPQTRRTLLYTLAVVIVVAVVSIVGIVGLMMYGKSRYEAGVAWHTAQVEAQIRAANARIEAENDKIRAARADLETQIASWKSDIRSVTLTEPAPPPSSMPVKSPPVIKAKVTARAPAKKARPAPGTPDEAWLNVIEKLNRIQ